MPEVGLTRLLRKAWVNSRNAPQEYGHTPDVQSSARNIDGLLKAAHFQTPQDTSFYGMEAVLRSSDDTTPEFFQKLQEAKPNGYIVGVGVGGVLGMINGFSDQPLGIIAADINPNVVVAGRVMVETLKSASTPDDFASQMFHISEEEYRRKVEVVLKADNTLAKGIKNWNNKSGVGATTPLSVPNFYKDVKADDNTLHVPHIIEKNFTLLKQLAESGNLAVCYADIADPTFLRALQTLPRFNDSTNIFYLSNAIDLGVRIVAAAGLKFDSMQALQENGNMPVYAYAVSKDNNNHTPTLRLARSINTAIHDSLKNVEPY